MGSDRYARQVLAFGDEGQRALEAARVGIVGLGGIGSQVAQALAHLGVGTFVLVDDDYVETTNLNRLVGAVAADADSKTPKVVVAERLIRGVNSDAAVLPIQKNLRSREALETLIGCPVIFGCVDHDAPRLILSELAAAYELILIDAATEILVEDGKLVEFGGRVIVARPGDYCLDCARQLDMQRAKWELATAEEREISHRHGYGLGEDAPAPAVVTLNGVVANLAVTEFLALTTGIRPPHRHLTYYALRGKVNVRTDSRREDCFVCGYLAGMREQANIFRYTQPSRRTATQFAGEEAANAS